MKYQLVSINEDVYELWIPLMLPWVPLLIWLNPRLRILKFKKGGDAPGLMLFLAYGTIAAIMMISNSYLKTSTGKLAEVQKIEELEDRPPRYVSIQRIELERELGSVYADFRRSGRYGQYLNFDLYFVYPFKSPESDHQFWIGVKFHDQVRNSLGKAEKEELYRAFYQASVINFENYNFSLPEYYEILRPSNDRTNYQKAIKKLNIELQTTPIIIEPCKGLYSNRNGKTLEWSFKSFGIGLVVFLVALIFPQYRKVEHQRQLRGVKPKSDDLTDILKFLVPRGNHFVTSIIIDLNILIFVIMTFSGVHLLSPNATELLEWGGNRRFETLNGEWWRLVSNIFLHGGAGHLIANIAAIALVWFLLEPLLGRVKFVLLYMISGIFASLASIYWHENVVSVGASGAIFGLFGCVISLAFSKNTGVELKLSTFIFIIPIASLGLFWGLTGGIDNAAHIGGLITGSLVGLIFNLLSLKHKNRN
ncbi:MAG: rhomboid family intramembrane serine protease [Owenweeksia sp.]